MQIFVSIHLIPPDLKFLPDANPPNYSNDEQVIEKGAMVRVKIMGLRMDVKDIVRLILRITNIVCYRHYQRGLPWRPLSVIYQFLSNFVSFCGILLKLCIASVVFLYRSWYLKGMLVDTVDSGNGIGGRMNGGHWSSLVVIECCIIYAQKLRRHIHSLTTS
jgi:hypothetical protein